ncbi:hypothetical protein RI367_007747 [Sorochytrium milnesiophthora]
MSGDAATQQAAVATVDFTPVDMCQSLLESIHTSGSVQWPWWATIASTTLLLRASLTLPLTIYQQRNLARMAALRPLATAWQNVIKEQTRKDCHRAKLGYDAFVKEFTRRYRRKMGELYAAHEIRPLFNLLLPFAQIPLWISMSLALRRMADQAAMYQWPGMPLDGFMSQGVLWAADLASCDPTWIAERIYGCGIVNTGEMVQIRNARGVRTDDLRLTVLHSLKTKAVVLFWVTSASYSLAQNLIFRLPIVKRLMQLNPPAAASTTPKIM